MSAYILFYFFWRGYSHRIAHTHDGSYVYVDYCFFLRYSLFWHSPLNSMLRFGFGRVGEDTLQHLMLRTVPIPWKKCAITSTTYCNMPYCLELAPDVTVYTVVPLILWRKIETNVWWTKNIARSVTTNLEEKNTIHITSSALLQAL